MAGQGEPFQVGQVLVVDGTVKVESANGVSRIIEPNSQIFLEDRIDTGSSGSVSIILSDGQGTQIDLGRLSEMVIDEDVLAFSLPDLEDVSVEAGLLSDLLSSDELTASVAPADTVVPTVEDGSGGETAAPDSIAGLSEAPVSVASSDSSDDGLGSLDEDLDMTNLIPPPEDST